MAYKRITDRLIDINVLAEECGLFFIADINGGYGCRSRSKNKQMPGACYAFDCPLAVEADEQDIIEVAGDEAEYYEPDGCLVRQYQALN